MSLKPITEGRRAEPNQLWITFETDPLSFNMQKQVEVILPSCTVRISVRLLSSLVSRRVVRRNVRVRPEKKKNSQINSCYEHYTTVYDGHLN